MSKQLYIITYWFFLCTGLFYKDDEVVLLRFHLGYVFFFWKLHLLVMWTLSIELHTKFICMNSIRLKAFPLNVFSTYCYIFMNNQNISKQSFFFCRWLKLIIFLFVQIIFESIPTNDNSRSLPNDSQSDFIYIRNIKKAYFKNFRLVIHKNDYRNAYKLINNNACLLGRVTSKAKMWLLQ